MPTKSHQQELTPEQKLEKKATDKVAKHARFNTPIKSAIMRRQHMEFFTGSKLVDCLMASQWTKEPKNPDSMEPHFIERSTAVNFCAKLLQQEYFVRARKIIVQPKPDEEEETEGGGGGGGGGGGQKAVTEGKKKTEKTVRKREGKATDSPKAKKQDKEEGENSSQGKEGKAKKKRKFRLEVHPQQTFQDSASDVYIWQYDPPNRYTYIIGFAVVAGAIAITLQPLWPDSTRAYVWYGSMGLFVLMGALVGMFLVRWFLFGLIAVLTLGKVHFWVFPNLDNEKLGFMESFKPFYSFDTPSSKKSSKKKEAKRKKREKSDSEDDENTESQTAQAEEKDKEEGKEQEQNSGEEEDKDSGSNGEQQQPAKAFTEEVREVGSGREDGQQQQQQQEEETATGCSN